VHVDVGRVYWFATANAPEGEKDGPLGSPAGVKAKLLRLYAGWHRPVADLVEATEEDAILRTDIYDREPLEERWGKGRVTLLGDVAHPMTPNLIRGACLAIEDAVVLGRCLDEEGGNRVLVYQYLITVTRIASGIVFFDEVLGTEKLVGGAVILVGVYLARRQ
jgi:2-polyprenyl-6-methoxyphenol hydroxylase-like FAD-dependent oxidoreductase